MSTVLDYTVGFFIVIGHLILQALQGEPDQRGGVVAISAARASARSTRVAKSTNSR